MAISRADHTSRGTLVSGLNIYPQIKKCFYRIEIKCLRLVIPYIFIIYICLKQNYIKQYKSLQTNTLFSGYRILKLTGFAKKGAIQDF